MIRAHLQWRKENRVDEIREAIISGKADCPIKFPKGEVVLQLMKQVVLHPECCDNHGSNICVETYDFTPSQVLSQVTLEEYKVFMIYCLEFRSLFLEQQGILMERETLARHRHLRGRLSDAEANREAEEEPYGVILHTCVIRDLAAVGMAHISAQGREIIRAVRTFSRIASSWSCLLFSSLPFPFLSFHICLIFFWSYSSLTLVPLLLFIYLFIFFLSFFLSYFSPSFFFLHY
jgi:hypothetical protein